MTALGLHADSVHLAGNLVFGLVFGFLAGERLGWGLAWFGMLLAGALGNTLNAFVQAPDHTSVGASTAVFATLGDPRSLYMETATDSGQHAGCPWRAESRFSPFSG